MSSTLRVVLDTNVLLSGLAYPGSVLGRIVGTWRHGAVDVVLSAFLLEELRPVLPRLSARHGLSSREIEDLVDILSIQAEFVEPEPDADEALRDDNDQPVLGTLLVGIRARSLDYLITGDKDLLTLANAYPILTLAEFWRRHGGV